MSETSGTWHDLSTEMHEGMPYPRGFPSPKFDTVSETDGHATPMVTQFTVCSHMGTHVDAPAHFEPGGRPLNEFPLERFIVPSVVWSIDREPGEAIPVSDFERASPQVRAGHAVLLSTGWGNKWGTDDYGHHPYLADDAAQWLVEHEVGLLGIDFMTPDRPVAARVPGYGMPVHHILLRADILIIENLTGLEQLAGQRVELHALPILIDAPDGAPVRAVARSIE